LRRTRCAGARARRSGDFTLEATAARAPKLDRAVRVGDRQVGSLIGYFHYKRPHGARLEIGLGLDPEWTGQGLGKSFLDAGLEYARRRFAPRDGRSLCTSGLASARVRMFTHWTNGGEWEFIEMRRSA